MHPSTFPRKVKAFAHAFKSKYDRLDLLVNNAGEYVPENDTTEDGFEVRCSARPRGLHSTSGPGATAAARVPYGPCLG